MSDAKRVVHQVSSWCLSYPDDEFRGRLPLLRAAVGELKPGKARSCLASFLDYVDGQDAEVLRTTYVDVFDMSRKHALHLSYWTDGDTRRRGEVLGDFKKHFRGSGFLVDTGGELPDFLPMVLEYAAVADPEDGPKLLQSYRPSIELLRIGLAEIDSPYAKVVEAICTTLPGASPADRNAVMKMAGAGPPTESVGLEPYDPRLLPLQATR